MNLIRSGDRFFNMDLIVDVEVGSDKAGKPLLKLRFAAPQPAGVGSDDWSAEPYEVTTTGREAFEVLAWLSSQAAHLGSIGPPSIEAMNAKSDRGSTYPVDPPKSEGGGP